MTTTTKATHTPGPWAATWTYGSRCAIHCGAWMSQGIVAVVHAAGNDQDFSKETADANARLIAAAPELLAALRSFLHADEDVFRAELAAARAAILKAEGKE